MKKILLTLVLFLLSSHSYAQSPKVFGERCVNSLSGSPICPPRGGDIAVNSIGQLVCGVGQCVVNSIGIVECSKEPQGYAAKNSIGMVKCSGGCENAKTDNCKEIK